MRPLNATEIILGSKLPLKGPTALLFQTGEIVKGRVYEVLSSNRVLIQLKNQLIRAKTEIPLRTGEQLFFEVLSTKGQVHLKRLPEAVAQNPAALLFKGLDVSGERSRSLAQIQQLLSPFKTLPEPILKKLYDFKGLDQFFKVLNEVSGETLKKAVESSGLFLEAKIKRLLLNTADKNFDTEAFRKTFEAIVQGDLKALLLKLKGRLRSKARMLELAEAGVDARPLLKEIDAVLNEISYQQFESKLKNGLQIFLPFVWKGLQEGRVFFKYAQEEGASTAEKSACSCTIYLKLEKIGKLKARIQMHSGLFYIRLISENAGFASLLEAGRDRLKTQLSRAGLQWGDLSVQHQAHIDFEGDVREGIDLKA